MPDMSREEAARILWNGLVRATKEVYNDLSDEEKRLVDETTTIAQENEHPVPASILNQRESDAAIENAKEKRMKPEAFEALIKHLQPLAPTEPWEETEAKFRAKGEAEDAIRTVRLVREMAEGQFNMAIDVVRILCGDETESRFRAIIGDTQGRDEEANGGAS